MAKPNRPTSRPTTAAKSSATKGLLISGGVLLVALVVLAIILAKPWAGDGEDDLADAAPYQPSVIEGAALPAPAEGGGVDAALGMSAPTVKGADFTGKPLTIAADGKPKAIIFYAHWCSHCQAEVPDIVDWLKERKNDTFGVEIKSVATGSTPTRPNFPPAKWFKEEKYPLPVMADDNTNKIATAFGLKSYPYFVFVDKDNKVVARTSGEISMTDLEGFLRQANPAAG